MNDNHQRHLLVTFRHIDNLLSEAEHLLSSAGSASPFAEYTQDSTPVQRKVIQDYIQRIRSAMVQAMQDLALPQPRPVCGALWAARGQITFASIAIAEMESKPMRGYGALSDADCQAIDAIVAELNAALDRLAAYLDKGPDADLETRLQKLEQTRNEVPLLRELERVITVHGLVEFRPTLAMLLDRMENLTFEIGMFGRVSSGKSSLLNHLLEGEFLPVGVTPVTAIPTRIRYGAQPQAIIEFAESEPLVIDLSRLAEFSTEQQNPGNAKHVSRIRVELPAQRLREGVTFVDTPGLGSLATSGAEETVAYLPRCDLGVVLVDAGSTLTHEDLTVVQALYQSGAKALVLVSKTDLLQAADRKHLVEYIENQLTAQLDLKLAVRPVSVAGAEAALCDQWLEQELMPLVETHIEQADAALRRKVGALREAVIRILENRLHLGLPALSPPSIRCMEEAITALRMADGLLEDTRRGGDEIVDHIPGLADDAMNAAAVDLAAIWSSAEGKTAAAIMPISSSINRVLADQVAKLVERLSAARRQLDQTLEMARQLLPGSQESPDNLPSPSGAPLADLAALTHDLELKRPALLSALGMGLERRYIRQRLEAQLDRSLPEFLSRYRAQLRGWFHQSMTELREAFAARAGILRAQLAPRGSSPSAVAGPANLEADLRVLRDFAVAVGDDGLPIIRAANGVMTKAE